jgi:O-antigen/teichoic acid export membrane protein
MTTLRRKMVFGAAWMMSVRLMDRSVGLASTVILARVLVPADFGVVAMAMGVVALLELFAAFGLDSALIQRKDIGRPHYDTTWTFNVLFGCAIGIALVALAWPAALFYQQPPLAWALVVLAAAPPIQGLENIGLVAFRRDLNFRADFLITTCKRLILFGITVSLALLLRSYWALVLGIIAGRALGVVLSYVVHPYRPSFSLAARAELFTFSKWMFGTNMVAFALQRSSDVVIGRVLGAQPLGLYNVGAEVATLPSSELVAPINRAVFPGFARIAGDRDTLRREYLTFIGFIAMIAMPAAVGVASIAHLIVPLMLGAKWLDAIPVVKIMALAGTLQVLQTTNYAVYLAVGRPSRQLVVLCVQLAVLLPGMILLSPVFGILGAAYAFALACAVALPVTLAMVLRELRAGVIDFLRTIWRPVFASSVMYFALRYFQLPAAPLTMQMIATLFTAVASGFVVYATVVLACWLAVGRPDSTETTVLHQLAEISHRLMRMGRGLRKSIRNRFEAGVPRRFRNRRLPAIAKDEIRRDRQRPGNDPGIPPVIDAALDWLCAAQDKSTSADGGVSRDYHLVRQWASSYPETTGYIVPTFLAHARDDARDLRARARRMLDWLVRIQLPTGAFQGGKIDSSPIRPVTFNTGQIVMGLAAGETTFGQYGDSLRKAADWLVATQDPDGCWRSYPTPFATPGEKTYETHVAWGLLEAARVDPTRGYAEAALRNIRWALGKQRDNGWLEDCCLTDRTAPLTHALGYALRGLLEGYRFSRDPVLAAAARRTADALLVKLEPDGYLAGRFNADWNAAVPWACLTGIAQIAHCWLLIYEDTGETKYLHGARRANAFVRRTVRLDAPEGIRGAVKGSFPVDGGYAPFEYPNWAAKFLIDSLALEQRVTSERRESA